LEPANNENGRDEPERPCHARDILDRVGDKWSVYVISLLGDRTRRFTDLLRGIEGISQRMLTVTLRGLERDGLVTRTVHPVVPPRVDYELTEMGRTLLATVRELMEWADGHTAEIDAARIRYDRREIDTVPARDPQLAVIDQVRRVSRDIIEGDRS
jgi:DNA-binding HxlR family transcriptional regulator